LLDLPFSAARTAQRGLDRRAFKATQRLALESRYSALPFTPLIVRALRWLWGWPVLSRRTGELENGPRQTQVQGRPGADALKAC
jgi:hypothetical protein